jgi:inhibitor of cysteine peptidase
MLKRAVTLLVIAVMVGGSCPASKGAVTYTNADSGKTIQLKRGSCISIVLEGNPTTGYTWELGSKLPPIIKQIKKPEYRSNSKMIGAGGRYTFQFKAIKPGKGIIKLVYHRSWEKNIPPARTFVLNITVID